jgi:carbamoyltransferase
MISWGISANSHDAAIAVFRHQQWNQDSTELLFASHAERFSGIKNDAHLNDDLIAYAKQYGDPEEVIWYEKPVKKTLRQMTSGQGWNFKENNIKKYLKSFGINVPIRYVSHHHSHAASAYYSSPFKEATVVCIDSIGEYETLSIWDAKDSNLKRIYSQSYPNSLGLFYSAMTQRVGLKPNEDEYILMGMAGYGNSIKYFYDILHTFFHPIDDDSLIQIFFNKPKVKLKHNLHKGCKWWKPELTSEQDMFDIAAGTQAVYEYLLKYISNWARWKSPSGNLVLSGGCALNCSANSKLKSDWNNIWIPPDPSDAGSAIGCVLAYYESRLQGNNLYTGYNIEGDYPVEETISELKKTGIVGVANGRAEFGPRALGNRSLLADPRRSDIKDKVNEIKRRQKFRPFAPAILEEHAKDYFEEPMGQHMQFTSRCLHPDSYTSITHIDGTSRVQTVDKTTNPGFRRLLERWYEETGCPMLLNTSLNIKGQPIVNDLTNAKEFAIMYKIKVF